jgi:peptidoglycan/xylan/chitin deacetylase (PgdA/CDA1 family)
MPKKILIIGAVVLAAVAFWMFVKPALSGKKSQQPDPITLSAVPSGPGRNFLPILAFHNIEAAPKGISKNDASFYIETGKFEEMLKNLKANDYQTVFVGEAEDILSQGKNIPLNWVALTFDDGKENFYDNALPLLKKYQIKSSLYIITVASSSNYLTKERVKEIDATGLVEIGSHTYSHQKMTTLKPEDQVKELTKSKKTLEDLLGKTIKVICYPYGDYNADVERLAKEAGYLYGLGFNNHPLGSNADLFAIDRAGVWPGFNVIRYLEGLKK